MTKKSFEAILSNGMDEDKKGRFANNVKSLKAAKHMQMWAKNILLFYEETFISLYIIICL